MTEVPRIALYERLPEIYRIRDEEQSPPFPLREYLAAVEEAFGAVHESVDALYHDLFIETCDPWVIPYLADLVGTSHLKGDPRTLRADVADTIALRRRKGTLSALERLAANLTGWACRCVELRENLGWTQHLNHQRPDAGGAPPYGRPSTTRFTVVRGGTVPVRDPAMLSLLGTPFDPFAYTADVKAADDDAVHVNLPNVAIMLWRLGAYRIRLTRPLAKGFGDPGVPPPGSGLARFALRFDLDPLDRPLRLFNTFRAGFTRARADASAVDQVGRLTRPDAVPGPILSARLESERLPGEASEAGRPEEYVAVDTFDDTVTPLAGFDLGDVGLTLFLPQNPFAGFTWTFRGDNLCAWEEGLRRPLRAGEVVIDPHIGRLVLGVSSAAQRDALITPDGGGFQPRIFVSYTYGAMGPGRPGPVGAHPVSRGPLPPPFAGQTPRVVSALPGFGSLQTALSNLETATAPIVVEIRDSLVHVLDLTTLPGATAADGPVAMRLNSPLLIRAADGHRPIVLLTAPLRFRPTTPGDPTVRDLTVRFEGIYLGRAPGFPAGEPLIARAAVARLELLGCTLDPGGHRRRDATFSRAPLWPALRLAVPYGFANAADEAAFAPTPDVVVQQSLVGALLLDAGYRLTAKDSVVDAGAGVGVAPADRFAIGPATGAPAGYGAPLAVDGLTAFGRVRVAEVSGAGGIFVHRLEALNDQKGCLKFSYVSGDGDRLPAHHACVSGPGAKLAFTSEWFNEPGYGQLARATDPRIRARGPGDDAMGAFGFLLEAHKWTNLQIRLREFMPVGVRPVVVPIT